MDEVFNIFCEALFPVTGPGLQSLPVELSLMCHSKMRVNLGLRSFNTVQGRGKFVSTVAAGPLKLMAR